MSKQPSDLVVDEIRETRHRISEQFDHDPTRLVAYYMQLQQKFSERLMTSAQSGEAKRGTNETERTSEKTLPRVPTPSGQ